MRNLYFPLWEELNNLIESGFIADYVANSLIYILKRPELSLEYLHSIPEPELRLKYKQLTIRTLKNCLKLHHDAIHENDELLAKRKELTRCAFLKTGNEQSGNDFFDEHDTIIAEAVAESNQINSIEKEKEKKKEEKKKEKEKPKQKSKDEDKEKKQCNKDGKEEKKQKETKKKGKEDKDNAAQDENTDKGSKKNYSEESGQENEQQDNKEIKTESNITGQKNDTNIKDNDQNKVSDKTSSNFDKQHASPTNQEIHQTDDILNKNKIEINEQSTSSPTPLMQQQQQQQQQQTSANSLLTDSHASIMKNMSRSLQQSSKTFEEIAQGIENPLQFVQNRCFDEVEQELLPLQNRNLSTIMNANRVLAALSLRLPSLNTNIDVLQKWQLFFAGRDIEKSSNVVGHEHQSSSVRSTSFDDDGSTNLPQNNPNRKHRRAASEQNKPDDAIIKKKHSKHSDSTKSGSVKSDEMPCTDESLQSHKKKHTSHQKKHRKHAHSGRAETHDFSEGLTDLTTEKAARLFDFFDFQYSLTDVKKESEDRELCSLEAEWRRTMFDPKYPSFLNFLFEWIVAILQTFPEGVEIPWRKLPGYDLFMRVFISNYKDFSKAKREFAEWYKANSPREAVNFFDSFGQTGCSQSICWNAVPTYFSRLPSELQISSFSCQFGDNSRRYYGCWETRLFDIVRNSVASTTPEVLSALVSYKLLSTPCYEYTEVVQAWDHIKNWFTLWNKQHKTITNGFAFDSIFSAMDLALDGESQRVALSVIQALEAMLDVFALDAKIDLVCNYLLRRNFFKLFLHWDADVRSGFCRLLTFKIYHPVDIIIHPEHANGISHHRMEQVTQNDIKTNLEIFVRIDGVIQKIRDHAIEIATARLEKAKEEQEKREAEECAHDEKEEKHEKGKTKEKDKKEEKAKQKNKQRAKEKTKAKSKEKEKDYERNATEQQDSLNNEKDNFPEHFTSSEYHEENEHEPSPNTKTNPNVVTDGTQTSVKSDEHQHATDSDAESATPLSKDSSQAPPKTETSSTSSSHLRTWVESSFKFTMSEHTVITPTSPPSPPFRMWEQWEHYCGLAVAGLDRWLNAYPYPIPLNAQSGAILPRVDVKRPVWKK